MYIYIFIYIYIYIYTYYIYIYTYTYAPMHGLRVSALRTPLRTMQARGRNVTRTHARAQGLCSEAPSLCLTGICFPAGPPARTLQVALGPLGITPGTQVESNTNIIIFASAVHIVPLPNRVFSQQSHCSGLVDIRGSPLKVAQGIHSRHLGGKQCQHQHICVRCTHRAFA